MYKIVTVRDVIRVPPQKFGMPLKEAVKSSLEDSMEGKSDPTLGIILAIVSVEKVGEGKIVPEDPSIFYESEFKALVYKPELHEMVVGEVVDNVEFGAMIRIGPVDGFVHISQIMDDFVSYDNKNSVFIGKQTRKTLKEGDKVRARIISISWSEQNKIGLTMRQPGLGSLVWIEESKRKKK